MMYELIARLFDGRYLVGYRFASSGGESINISLDDSYKLVSSGRVYNAEIVNGGKGKPQVKLIGNNISNLPKMSAKGIVPLIESSVSNKKVVNLLSVYTDRHVVRCKLRINTSTQNELSEMHSRLGSIDNSSDRMYLKYKIVKNSIYVDNIDFADFRMLCLGGNIPVYVENSIGWFIENRVEEDVIQDTAIKNLVLNTFKRLKLL